MNTKKKITKRAPKKDKIFVFRQANQFLWDKESVIKQWPLAKALLAGKETYIALNKAMVDEARGWGIKTVSMGNKNLNKVFALTQFLQKLNEIYPNILLEIIGKKSLS